MTVDFPPETTKTRRNWQNVFHMLKEKKSVNQNSVSSKSNIQEERKIKILSEEGKLRELVVSRTTMKEWLKEVIYTGRKKEKRNLGTSERNKKHDK